MEVAARVLLPCLLAVSIILSASKSGYTAWRHFNEMSSARRSLGDVVVGASERANARESVYRRNISYRAFAASALFPSDYTRFVPSVLAVFSSSFSLSLALST